MAAWLAFLKSKLLIPKQSGDDGQTARNWPAVLQFRLKRLEAMRDAAASGQPQPARPRRLRARHAGNRHRREAQQYRRRSTTCSPPMPAQRQRQAITNVRIAKRGVWSLKEARDILIEADRFGSDRLDGARQVPDRISDNARGEGDGDRQFVRREPRTGPRGKDRNPQHEPFAPIYLRGNRAGGQADRGRQ
jgi:segregation and condensation protein A